MKKTVVVVLLVLSLASLIALASGALFTSSTTAKHEFAAGTLKLGMKAEDAPESGISGLMSGDRSWIPGDHREALLTIKNEGSLDARWRLGIIPSGQQNEALLDELIITFYALDQSGDWKLIKSERLKDALVIVDSDHWLYDKSIVPAGSFAPLKPGRSQQLVMEMDFDLTAMSPLQGEQFQGKLVLQAAQVNQQEWFPIANVPINIEIP